MQFLWTSIYVKNLEESIDFYSNLLGLHVTKRFPAGPGMEIAFMGNGVNNETLVELIVDHSKQAINFSEFISIGFAVDSVDDMLDAVKCNYIPILNGPIETPGSKFFFVKDPNGLTIQLYQHME